VPRSVVKTNSDSRDSLSSRSRAGSVSAIVRTQPCFGSVNSRTFAFHCWSIRIVPAWKSMRSQRSASSSPGRNPLVDRGVQVGRERGWCQLVGERDEAGDVGLAGRLDVAPATARAQPELRERVAVDEAPGLHAGSVVEEGPQLLDGAAVAVTFGPGGDVLIPDRPERKVSVLG
jgi:hypothetical protein